MVRVEVDIIMFRNLKSYLKSNDGDGYIVYIIFLLVFFIMVGVLISILTIRITTAEIYNEVENSADMVISAMKEESYQSLINGTTDGSILPFNTIDQERNREILRKMEELLRDNNVDENGNSYNELNDYDPFHEYGYYFEKYNANKILQYRIGNIGSFYNPSNGLIEVSFTIHIPIRINGVELFVDEKTFTKETSFRFKEFA